MMQSDTISILGTGWLGLPLSKYVQKMGFGVKASTQTNAKLDLLLKFGLDPFLLSVGNKQGQWQPFLDSSQLIINITNKTPDDYQHLCSMIKNSAVKRVIFISSSSVYKGKTGLISEDNQLENETHPIRKIERQLLETNKPCLIIRFGGLIGNGRQPANFFRRRNNCVPDANQAVNLIHYEDCINVLIKCIQHPQLVGEFNCCAPSHPTKAQFYRQAARSIGQKLTFLDTEKQVESRIMLPNKIMSALKYKFVYPDLLSLPFERLGDKED